MTKYILTLYQTKPTLGEKVYSGKRRKFWSPAFSPIPKILFMLSTAKIVCDIFIVLSVTAFKLVLSKIQ